MRVPQIREFNEQDWYLLAGAEKFDDGRGPFVADDFEYSDVITVADKHGIQVLVNGKEFHLPIIKENLKSWESQLGEEFFRLFVGSVASMMTDDEVEMYIKAMGFRPAIANISGDSKVCPICGERYVGHSALSRKDNNTEICPACGMNEALEDYFNSMDVMFKED